MTKRPFKEVDRRELFEWLRSRGQAPFRLRQINEWLYRHWSTHFDQMRNVPLSLRRELAADYLACTVTCRERVVAADGTVKFLLSLADGETVETVLIPAAGRNTVCLSTQVGCAVRCVFCASGRHGLVRDLTPSEIIDQVLHTCRDLGSRVSNVVVMGMGEPLLNLDNVVTALEALCSAEGLGLGARHITISTSGIVPGILRLAQLRRQWNLALSLHAASDELRRRFIPDRYRYPLQEVLDACAVYARETNRMVTLEYALVDGVNDRGKDVEELAAMARQLRAKVNLIPCNPVTGRHAAPGRDAIRRFLLELQARGANATIRSSRGAEIAAACGQLRQRSAVGPGQALG